MGRALARIANTPRPLIQSIWRVMKPDPRGKQGFTIYDPACGTGGLLVAAYARRGAKLTTDFTDNTGTSSFSSVPSA